MSISTALANAFSGLTANARLAEIASDNIANAQVDGYMRRQGQLGAQIAGTQGRGVRVIGVERLVDQGLVQENRLASAGLSAGKAGLKFLKQIESAFGLPGESGALTSRLAAFESALVEAAARPESSARLTQVAERAGALATGLRDASDQIAKARSRADTDIVGAVQRLNTALKGIRTLNKTIGAMAARGEDFTSLLDERQRMVDQVADLVPLREVAGDHHQIALYTTTGQTLLDSRAATFGFSPTASVTPEKTLAGGGLSGLTIDGQPLSAGPDGGQLGEGGLSALFELRDGLAVSAQARLDALARDLVTRLSGSGIDPTLASGEAGLFVDSGTPSDLAAPGLAGRIALSDRVDPSRGGEVWRLRDGLNATTPGTLANPSLLQSYRTALNSVTTTGAGGVPATGSFATLLSETQSQIATDRLAAESANAFAAARSDTLATELQRMGVDTDQEMQDLLQIEKSYAANARVIQTVDDMLRTLLEI